MFEFPRVSHPSAGLTVNFRGAPNLRSANSACDEDLGRPASCIFRLYRRWRPESPRVSHPSAWLAVRFRVAPEVHCANFACDGFPGFPESRIFRFCQRVNFRVAPNLRALWLRCWMIFRVASNHASLSGAGVESSGYPESSCPPALPSLRIRVAPTPALTTGSMMNPRLSSNFASSACAADESSRPSESCTFLPYSLMHSQSQSDFPPSLAQL
jgi:hypothetical protein